MRKHFFGRKKMWRRKTTQRVFQRLAHTRLWFFVARAAEWRRSVYRLLSDGLVF